MSTAPINLYLDLEKGHLVDLEVAARTALALSDLVKEIYYVLDPLDTISIQLVDGTRGSLSLNTIINNVRNDKETRKKLMVAVWMASGWLGGHAAEKAWDRLTDWAIESVAGPDEAVISEADKEDMAERCARHVANKVGQIQAQRFYQEIDRDPGIKGVGIAEEPGIRPVSIVPREEFPFRAGTITQGASSYQRRVRYETKRVVLISPVLLSGKRRWRFRSKEGEFGAPVQDEAFISKLLSGSLVMPMKSDVEMTVEMRIVDEFRDGVWVPAERAVIRVVGVPQSPSSQQGSLFPSEE